MFDKLVNPQVRNTLVTDMLSMGDETATVAADGTASGLGRLRTIPADIHKALTDSKVEGVPTQAYLHSHLTVKGLTYTVRAKHEGNSNIFVLTKSKIAVPASITNFVTFNGDTYVIVQRYRAANVCEEDDPYLAFPWMRSKMWSTSLRKQLEVVAPQSLNAHFAKCVTRWKGEDVAVVISLSRVSAYVPRKCLSDGIFQTLLSTSSETQSQIYTNSPAEYEDDEEMSDVDET